MSEGCPVCKRVVEESGQEYCSSHDKALAGLRGAYMSWLKAYGNIGFKDYLERVTRLPETGERVKEAARFLAQHPERWNKSKP